ncbi:MAG: hypothetical protein QXP27_03815 [Candidatus Methanomethyliaceae archaeon]
MGLLGNSLSTEGYEYVRANFAAKLFVGFHADEPCNGRSVRSFRDWLPEERAGDILKQLVYQVDDASLLKRDAQVTSSTRIEAALNGSKADGRLRRVNLEAHFGRHS